MASVLQLRRWQWCRKPPGSSVLDLRCTLPLQRTEALAHGLHQRDVGQAKRHTAQYMNADIARHSCQRQRKAPLENNKAGNEQAHGEVARQFPHPGFPEHAAIGAPAQVDPGDYAVEGDLRPQHDDPESDFGKALVGLVAPQQRRRRDRPWAPSLGPSLRFRPCAVAARHKRPAVRPAGARARRAAADDRGDFTQGPS